MPANTIRMTFAASALVAALAAGPAAAGAPRWGDFKDDACRGDGLRQYSAILWDIPWGADWKDACERAGATLGEWRFERPTRCVHTGNAMWGEFDVPDASCATAPPSPPPTPVTDTGYEDEDSLTLPGASGYVPPGRAARPMRPWGKFKPHACSELYPGHRNYYAVLKGISKKRWLQTCYNSPAELHGWSFEGPDQCLYLLALGGWVEATQAEPHRWSALAAVGEFPIPDDTCP
jgi:hypothetical protein